MAASRRSQIVDRGVTLDTLTDKHHSSLRSRARSRSQDRSGGRKQITTRSRSRSIQRDDDRYRPTRTRDVLRPRSPSASRRRHYSPTPRSHRKESRSPRREARPPRSFDRRHSRDKSLPRARPVDSSRRDPVRPYPPRSPRDSHRNNRDSPRRRSPDRYIPPTRRRSKSPVTTTYRSVEHRPRGRSPVQEIRTAKRNSSPRPSEPRRRPEPLHSRSPGREGRSHRNAQGRTIKREDEKHQRLNRRSTSLISRRTPPPSINERSSRQNKHRRRSNSPSQSPPRRKQKIAISREDSASRNRTMGDRYYHGAGRGGYRGGRAPSETPGYGHPAQFYPPDPMSPHVQSPYGDARGAWGAQSPYGSHQGSPIYPPVVSPYSRQGSFPPVPAPGFYPPVPPPPPYAVTPYYPPPYSPQDYPAQPYRSSSVGNHHSPPDRRLSGPSASLTPSATPSRRGHYSNLSWTPATGSRGGIQVPPRGRGTTKDAKAEAAEEEDNQFRPAKALRAEDESTKVEPEEKAMPPPAQRASPRPETNTDNKIKFALKGKPAIIPGPAPTDLLTLIKPKPNVSVTSGLAHRVPRTETREERRQANVGKSRLDGLSDRSQTRDEEREDERQHETRQIEKKPGRRIKPRPTLPPEFAMSESVYFRKPGNESVVGSGTYGKVFRAIHVYTGEKVALKKIRMEGERDGFPVTAIREVKLLQSLNHDNVVKLQEVMVEKNDCYMVFEYLSHDLTGLLNHPTFKLDNSHKKHLARQLFEGLDYLHRRGVLHRDIKAANILISNTGQLKLADFGLARFFAKRRQLDYTNRVITIWYRSPELLLGETQYGPAVDIWSAACVLVEIFTRHAIFPGDGGEINQLDKIYNVLGTPTRSEWPGIVDMAWFELLRPAERKSSTFADKYKDRVTVEAFELLSSMFAYDPKQRPSAGDVLEHPYFITEEPSARPTTELKDLQGDWHEFESKALRKERERVDRDARKAREIEVREVKRKTEDGLPEEREVKKTKIDTTMPEEGEL